MNEDFQVLGSSYAMTILPPPPHESKTKKRLCLY